MKLKEIFDQSDTIIEPWPDFEANCFRVGGPCRSAFKLGLTKAAPSERSVVLAICPLVNATYYIQPFLMDAYTKYFT